MLQYRRTAGPPPITQVSVKQTSTERRRSCAVLLQLLPKSTRPAFQFALPFFTLICVALTTGVVVHFYHPAALLHLLPRPTQPALQEPATSLTLTCVVLTTGVVASGGSGRIISTFVAVLRSFSCDRALTRYSVRLRLGFSTRHSTQISGLMF